MKNSKYKDENGLIILAKMETRRQRSYAKQLETWNEKRKKKAIQIGRAHV